ncbi:hypothetical protein F5B19DRAFT_366361 [Rostrohypoxylon terebratum]|nr:hypothetical protein F5B19DRAFT_366361 [Rostrohypoxylon terebratum]
MDLILILWPSIANGAENAADIFQHGIVAQFVSSRSIETLVTRSDKSTDNVVATILVIILALLGVIALFMLIIVDYALCSCFPTLAVIEDDAPESYERVPNGDDVELEDSEANKTVEVDENLASRPKPITSGLRSTYQHVCSFPIQRPLLRGFRCWMVLRAATNITIALFSAIPFVPMVVVWPIACMLTLPLYTTWIHIVITEPSSRPFWRRLPPPGLVYRAATRAALPYFVIRACEGYIVSAVAFILMGWKKETRTANPLNSVLAFIAAFALWAFVEVPTNAVLIRVQASLLPEGSRTIVPLHSSMTLHRASGKEYLATSDAWRSFSKASWVRLYKMYAKIALFLMALWAGIGAIGVSAFFYMSWLSAR